MKDKISSIVILVLVILISGCHEPTENERLPFERSKVLDILCDAHFAKSSAKIHSERSRDSLHNLFMSQVFEINGITKAEYDNLMSILESDMILYFQIEKEVHARLKRIQKSSKKNKSKKETKSNQKSNDDLKSKSTSKNAESDVDHNFQKKINDVGAQDKMKEKNSGKKSGMKSSLGKT